MHTILPAQPADAALLARLGGQTFIESHGHSAPPAVIAQYVEEKFRPEVLEQELAGAGNQYFLLHQSGMPVGYAKIRFSEPHPNLPFTDVTKLDRLYLLAGAQGNGGAAALFHYLVQHSQRAGQKGMWLYVWTQNPRAVAFYRKQGFREIGRYDFRLTDAHANPNYQMLLTYDT
ncbi:MAG TPA: GNAT family N-acetyltransferase [Chitinophagaceae bacterium]|jgi:ribosomal protein S18 acetylase RimI-like enzyme|nr:GNAT family N-acetyltransferase [Chitinophagaceae bacterium]